MGSIGGSFWIIGRTPLTEASPGRFITMNERATDDEDDQLPIKATPEDLPPMLAGKLPNPTSLTRKGVRSLREEL
jgi:hypothetical protein